MDDARRFLDAITFAGDGDDLGVVQEPVEDGSGGGHIAKQYAPFFQQALLLISAFASFAYFAVKCLCHSCFVINQLLGFGTSSFSKNIRSLTSWALRAQEFSSS